MLTTYHCATVAGIETLYQLMGFFARYRGLGVTQEQWTQAFYTWLIFQGANAGWAHTVTTVLADKLSILFDPAVCPVFNVDTFGRCDPNKLLPLPRRKRVDFPARSSVFDLLKSKMTNTKISDFIEKADALALGPLAKVWLCRQDQTKFCKHKVNISSPMISTSCNQNFTKNNSHRYRNLV